MKILKFHTHLDICAQCREMPFDLCLTGQLLLREDVRDHEGLEVATLNGRFQRIYFIDTTTQGKERSFIVGRRD